MDPAQQHFLEGKKIIVAGAGIAGLAFVIGLRKQWNPALQPPSIVVYDRDSEEASVNREGYSISLAGYDETGGLFALNQLGLLDEILQHAILGLEGTGCFKVWDTDWKELLSVRFRPAAGLPTAGIRIARKHLRQVLIDAVTTTDTIVWGTSCIAAEKLDTGLVKVTLAGTSGIDGPDADSDECHLLVAADGASSRIRGCLRPNDGLQYAGVVQFGGSARFQGSLPQPVDNNWGLMLSGQGVSCFFSPVDKHSVVWALSRLEANPRGQHDRNSPTQIRRLMDEALELGSSFGEPFKTLVEATDPATTLCLNARDKLPLRHDKNGAGIVFIGDSNHAVSPFAGYGASLALKDGWDLADQLCGGNSMELAVAAFDSICLPRATKVLKESRRRIEMGHSTGLKFLLFRCFITLGSWMLWIMGRS